MSQAIQDKIHAFIAARGDKGATTDELAATFLFPTGKLPPMAATLVKAALAGDPRIAQQANGLWTATLRPTAAPASAENYTVIESSLAFVGRRPYPVDVSAVRLDAAGKTLGARTSPIRPDPWPQGLTVPPRLADKARQAMPFAQLVPKVAEFAKGSTLVAWRPNLVHFAVADSAGQSPVLSLERLAKRRIDAKLNTAGDLAARLGLTCREPMTAADAARFTTEIFAALIAQQQSLGLGPPSEWVNIQHGTRREVDYSRYDFDADFVAGLPQTPGIYIMFDAARDPLYVGKAQNLRERVRSYFRARFELDEKTERILESLHRLEVQETGSDLGAFLAEYEKIQELEPAINVQFDIHQRPAATQAPHKRLLLPLPAVSPDSAELFLLHGDQAMRRLTIPHIGPEKARAALEEFFFSGKAPAPPDASDREQIHIAWSWLDRNADKANAFDVDLAGGLANTMSLLEQYLNEAPDGGKVFHV